MGVEDRDKKHSVNVHITVNSRRLGGPRSNLNLFRHIWDTYMFSFLNMPTQSIPPWSAWPTSKILGRRVTGGYRQLGRYIKVPSSSSTQRR